MNMYYNAKLSMNADHQTVKNMQNNYNGLWITHYNYSKCKDLLPERIFFAHRRASTSGYGVLV